MLQASLIDIRPSDLPSPPQSSLNILQACSQKDIGLNQLSGLVSKDTVLTAELLRVVNSAYFGMSKEVKSLTKAVTIIGNETLRNMVLCLSMRDVVNQNKIAGIDLKVFWLHSLQRAVCARVLSEFFGLDKEECFVAGLLQDFGLLVLFFINKNQAKQWNTLCVQDPGDRYELEKSLFHTTHDELIESLGQSWLLPDELTQALAKHHNINYDKKSGSVDKLAYLLCCVDWMAAVFSAKNKSRVVDKYHQLLEARNITKKQRQDLLTSVPLDVKNAAQAMGIQVAKDTDYDKIIGAANLELAEANLSYQELTWKLQLAIKERDHYAEELNNEIKLAKEVQRSLLPDGSNKKSPLTGINIPAKDLSGDFYDFFTRTDGKIYFSLGDVSGKGMNAALLMSKTASLIRCLGKQISDPCELMSVINAEICETSIRGMFVTVILGTYDTEKDIVEIVNAGNPPALIISRAGKINKIDAQAPPIGILSEAVFSKTTFKLMGNSLYLFSDGVTEGYTRSGEMLGVKGLVDILRMHSNARPSKRMQAVVDCLHTPELSAKDDITMLLLDTSQ